MKIDIFNTDKKYGIIYADPPWSYKTWSGKGKEKKSAENQKAFIKLLIHRLRNIRKNREKQEKE